jgi:hypothetical protein
VVHGAPSRFNDPARFAFAHGGKDGHPHPVPLKTYDESLNFLRQSLDAAKVGHTEKLDGFRRLDRFVRMVETKQKPRADLDALIRHENAISPSLNGRTGVRQQAQAFRQSSPRARCSKGLIVLISKHPLISRLLLLIFFAPPTENLPRQVKTRPECVVCIPNGAIFKEQNYEL